MKMQQGVAQILEESGLFNWAEAWGTQKSEKGDYREEFGKWPDADQAERILAEMGLAVVLDSRKGTWILCEISGLKYGPQSFLDESVPDLFEVKIVEDMLHLKKGERTAANNAALAYLCQHKKEELAQAINGTNN